MVLVYFGCVEQISLFGHFGPERRSVVECGLSIPVSSQCVVALPKTMGSLRLLCVLPNPIGRIIMWFLYYRFEHLGRCRIVVFHFCFPFHRRSIGFEDWVAV